MRDLESLFAALQQSSFRRGFRLRGKDLEYLRSRGIATVTQHAADFIAKRLAPAAPPNDGKQTPWRGHPVFVAQHATATCCRGCLEKWHGIARGQQLTEEQQHYVVSVIARWLRGQFEEACGDADSPPANVD
jgi:predicted Fe-S protein YdhL (DUF1289 family)